MMTQTDKLRLNMFDASDKFNNDALNENWQKIDDSLSLTGSAQGESITITDGADNCGLYSLYIEGKSVQNGTPTPDDPIDIDNIGDGGSLDITACRKNLLSYGALSNQNTFSVRNDGFVSISNVTTYTSYCSTALGVSRDDYIVSIEIEQRPSGAGVYVGRYKGDYSNFVTTSKNVLVSDTDVVYINCVIPANSSFVVRIGVYKSDDVPSEYEAYIGNTATITTALPLCSVGDICDELIFNANGTAKIIKRTAIVQFVGASSEYWALSGNSARIVTDNIAKSVVKAISNASVVALLCNRLSAVSANNTYAGVQGVAIDNIGRLSACIDSLKGNTTLSAWTSYLASNPLMLVYPLATPQEISLTADETAALLSLETFEGLTNVFNSDNAVMSIKYWRNEDVGSLLTSTIRNTNSRLAALENTLIGG